MLPSQGDINTAAAEIQTHSNVGIKKSIFILFTSVATNNNDKNK